jgi:hypothetical protein
MVDEVVEPTQGEVVETTPVEQTPAVETKVESAEPVETKSESGEGDKQVQATDEETVEGAYKPNIKFKVLDTEHEIPKEFQALMKDPESEKLVRELHEKAYGLDGVKTKLNETRAERETIFKENTQIKGNISDVKAAYEGALKSGNYLKLDDFLAKLRIPEEVMMKWAVAKAQFAEMPAEQRGMIAAQMEAERRVEAANFQQQQFQTQMQDQATRIKRMEFESVLARPDIIQAQKEFETRVGKPGSFRDQVARHGELRFFQSNGQIDLSPDQAVSEVLAMYNIKPGTVGSAAPTQAAPVVPTAQTSGGKTVVQRTTKTIPNLQGGTASPVRKAFTSIDEIKKYSKEKYGNPNS